MYPPLELIHKRCALSCSQYNNPQVDVPSTCTTKDVPSNVLGQRMLGRLVLWNLLLKGKGRIKRILRRLVLWIFCKGDERHKRIEAVSPSFFWQREKRDTKEFRRLVLRSFGKGRREWRRKNSTSFLTKNFSWKRKFWTKTLRKKLRNESNISVERWRETR